MNIEKLLADNLLNVITESIIIVDLEGCVIYWNKGAEKIFGYSQQEILGNSITKIYPNLESAKFESDIERIQKGEVHIGEWEGRRKDGATVWVDLRNTVLKDEKGLIIGFIGISQDITEVVNSRMYKYQLSSIVEFSNDGIESIDLEGNILSWNKGAEEIYGYTAEEIVGKNAISLYTKENFEEMERNLRKIKSGELIRNFITKRKRKSGKIIDVSITFSAIKNVLGNIVGISVITRDITEQNAYQRILEENEIKYKTIFENSGEGFLLFNEKFVDVNKKATEIFACPKEEIIGKSPMDFSPKFQPDGTPSREKAEAYINKALNNETVGFYWQHLNKKSEIIEAKVTLNKINIEGVPHLIALVQDMTELFKYQNKLKAKTKELVIQNEEFVRLNEELKETNKWLKGINKQIEENERKFRVAFKTSPDAVNINRMSDGLYLEINEGFTLLTGYTEEDVKGKTSTDINIWNNAKDRKKLVTKLEKDGFVSNLEAKFRKKDGTLTTALMSASIIEIKRKKYILSITRDISDRKVFEEKLKRAIEKAKESDMLKSAFLANMSHEIRTPMNAILGFAQLLKEKKLDHEKQTNYLNIITSRSLNLLGIINDIIDISKIEANQLKIEIKEFSLNKLLYELFSNYEMELMAQKKDAVKLDFRTDLSRLYSFIESDELRLKQILNNLISNAVKFTESGKIEFGYKVKNKNLEFFVSDTGIGIPKEYHNHIFERFRQADDSSTRQYGGTGLGLSICKQLVSLLGGKIWLESIVKQSTNEQIGGTTFYFTIPYSFNEKIIQRKESPDAVDVDLTGKTIMIVEDDLISMAYLEELLSVKNANIIKAFNGFQALEKFKVEKGIDMILMDIHMPQMNGNEVAKKIREGDKKIPIIAQSAYSMPTDKIESLNSGCSDYLTKPIDARLFFLTIKKYLKE